MYQKVFKKAIITEQPVSVFKLVSPVDFADDPCFNDHNETKETERGDIKPFPAAIPSIAPDSRSGRSGHPPAWSVPTAEDLAHRLL